MPGALTDELRSGFARTIEFRDALIDDYKLELVDVANRLEREIIRYTTEFTTSNGRFVGDKATLAKLRRSQVVLEEGLADAGYYRRTQRLFERAPQMTDKIAAAYKKVVGVEAAFTTPDLEAFRAAMGAQMAGFANLGQRAKETIRSGLARAVAGESRYDDWLADLRHVLIGEGRRDKAGQGMFRHAATLADTSMSQLHQSMNRRLAENAGITRFVYSGPNDRVTRPFCRKLMNQVARGKTWTKREIDRLDNKQITDTFSSRGGWNCRHEWLPVTREAMEAAQQAEARATRRRGTPAVRLDYSDEIVRATLEADARKLGAPIVRAWAHAGANALAPNIARVQHGVNLLYENPHFVGIRGMDLDVSLGTLTGRDHVGQSWSKVGSKHATIRVDISKVPAYLTRRMPDKPLLGYRSAYDSIERGGLEGLITHEYGHAIAGRLKPAAAREFVRLTPFGPLGMNQAVIRRTLGEYAGSNHEELFAELFALAMDRNYRAADYDPWVQKAVSWIRSLDAHKLQATAINSLDDAYMERYREPR